MSNYKLELLSKTEGNSFNQNVDVNIVFEDGSTFFGTFFTLENINTIMQKHKKSGENCNGSYFWSTNMCVVVEIREDILLKTIDDLLEADLFNDVFCRIE